ncbi:hypothetical protein OQA88_8635 [Cercophora sp. LCS_1]
MTNTDANNSIPLVVFPTQKPSQILESEWIALEGATKDIKVMSIDCSVDTVTCIAMDAVSYPAIRLYHGDNQFTRYRGRPKASLILSFIRRANNPIISQITPETLPTFTTSDDITFTAQLPLHEAPLYEWQYRDLAEKHHLQYSFAILPPSPSQFRSVIRCRNNPNDENYTLKELWLVGAMDELVRQCSTPLILEPTRKGISELGRTASQDGKTLVLHYFASSEKQKDDYKKEMLGLAKRYEAGVFFTVIDVNVHALMPGLAGLELKGGVGDGVLVEDLMGGEVFPYSGTGNITAEKLEAFLKDVMGGKAKAWGAVRAGEGRHDEL